MNEALGNASGFEYQLAPGDIICVNNWRVAVRHGNGGVLNQAFFDWDEAEVSDGRNASSSKEQGDKRERKSKNSRKRKKARKKESEVEKKMGKEWKEEFLYEIKMRSSKSNRKRW